MVDINTLKEYPLIDSYIETLTKKLENLKERKIESHNTLKSMELTDMPICHEPGNSVLNAIQKIVDNFEESVKDIQYKIDQWQAIQKEVTNILFTPGILTKEERQIIDLVFFQEVNWKFVPGMMKYSYRQCYRFQKSALNKMGIQEQKQSA